MTRSAMRLSPMFLACCVASTAHAGTATADADSLSALRPALRSALPAAAGLSRLDQLPTYDFAIDLDPQTSSFRLEEHIDLPITTDDAMGEILFQIYANVGPSTPPVSLVRGECSPSCDVRFEAPAAILVKPTAPLAKGKRLRVRLELRGAIERIGTGQTDFLAQALGSMTGSAPGSGYGLLATGEGISVLANFYAVLGRRHGNIWEKVTTPAVGDLCSDDIANYHAVIDVPSNSHVVTNGAVVATSASGRTASRHKIDVRAPLARDFVLVVGDQLEAASRTVNGVTIESHFLRDDRRAGEQVLDTAARAMEVYERRFGAYPYARLAIVEAALVGGAGGVEFSGVALVGSTFYRSFDRTSAMGAMLGSLTAMSKGPNLNDMMRSMGEFVTAHEVAHQWWHALVGSDSRWHPFVDESLAQYSTVLYLEDRYGAAKAEEAMRRQLRSGYAMMRLIGEPDAAVDRPVTAFASSRAYGGLVYGKGGYLYRTWRSIVGDQTFFDGLREYVLQNRFRLADPEALVTILARGAHASEVKAAATRFLLEKHGDDDLGPPDLAAVLSDVMGTDVSAQAPMLEQLLKPLLARLSSAKGSAPLSLPFLTGSQR
jgi:hypothetical protein